MAGKSPFVALILMHMSSAERNAQALNGLGACRHLEAAATLVKAKYRTAPPTQFNPRYSVGANEKLIDHYHNQLPTVAGAVREYIDSTKDTDFSGIE